ncbi:MAG: hypothetical protein H5U38_07370 [Calditrichaeota bacterium]|nr:hypothetical protein [Calditrichota bacterium]
MRRRLLSGVMGVGWLLLGSVALAGEGIGGYAGAFLRMGVTPRAQAMGDAFVAVPEGPCIGLYNPAGVALLSGPQLTASAGALALDRSLYVLGFALPIHPKGIGAMDGGLGLTWVHGAVHDIDGRDADGVHIGTFSNAENAFVFTFAVRPHRAVAVGMTGMILYNRLPGVTRDNGTLTSSGVGVHLGVAAMPVTGLVVGAAVHNINAKYTWNTESVYERGTSVVDRFPLALRAGASYRPAWGWLLASAELEQSDKQGTLYRLGVEATISRQLALRAGVDNGRLRCGLGFSFPVFGRAVALDYAFLPTVEGLAADHMFAWVFHF